MLAVLPLIPLGYAAAAAGAAALIGWVSGRVKKGEEIKKQDEKVEHLENMVQQVINNQEQDNAPPEADIEYPTIEEAAPLVEPSPLVSKETLDTYVAALAKEMNNKKTINEILSQDPMEATVKSDKTLKEDSGDIRRFELMDL